MMLPTQLGDRTDEVTGGEGCGGTAGVMFEYGVYFTYWAQGVVLWMF